MSKTYSPLCDVVEMDGTGILFANVEFSARDPPETIDLGGFVYVRKTEKALVGPSSDGPLH